jgi:arylsulfatase A-like enzyme
MASRGMRMGIGVAAIGVVALGGYLSQFSRPAAEAKPIRLVDVFKPAMVQGSPTAAAQSASVGEWRFDGAPPESLAKELVATRGWDAHNVSGLAVRDSRLVGRSTSDFPIVHVSRTTNLDNADQLYGVEVRVRVSAGANLSVATQGAAPANLPRAEALARRLPWTLTTPLLPGSDFQTYVITSTVPVNMARSQQVLIRPTDAANATFEIESVRLITAREHLGSVKSGAGWQGLKDIFHEALVSRAPETLRFDLDVPANARLDLALGTMEDLPPTFNVIAAADGGEPQVLLAHTVTTPNRWEWQSIDLAAFAGRRTSLSLSLAAEKPGTLGLWGTPTIRARSEMDPSAPRGVILIHADTLRTDHLGMYGHTRDTAPFLAKLAKEGAMFTQAYAQAGWTKVSTSSFMTSLYPTTHGVKSQADRLPASATTTAEVYRAAGYATVSFSSVAFTGLGTNLHQGYEELHERTSVDTGPQYTSKTAREFVDRASDWIQNHRDTPFFMYLHFFDPHPPFEPRRPWDSMWADPTKREEHLQQRETVRKVIANPFMADRGMATRGEMLKAGIDPATYLAYDKDWYDGSIRGLDAELARLFERLRALGLDRDVAVAFLADHGEEFQEHGRMWHGQSVYAELMHVPLVVHWPAGIQGGRVIDEPVELIDVAPTLLDFSALAHPHAMQGQSLLPLLRPSAGGTSTSWKRRPVIMEKQPMGGGNEHPEVSQAFAIIDGNWKLIHNTVRDRDRPEYELFDVAKDPLDARNIAADHPDIVQRLSKALDGWQTMATAARLKPDTETTKALSAEELQRLRSLGYVR